MNAGNNKEELLKSALQLILDENIKLINKLDIHQISSLSELIQNADKILVKGVGRSGLAMSAFAMRLIHLGYKAHIVGEITAPPITSKDLLIVASGSGNTLSVIKAAEKAKEIGAAVACFTTEDQSPLAKLSDAILMLPATNKFDYSNAVSEQYAGTLFEQSLLLLCDAVFHTLWKIHQLDAAEMFKRHSNLE